MTGQKQSRRPISLRSALALGTALAGSLIIPAFAQAPAPKTPIQHVVVLFQENITFDHYFGTYPNAANNPGEQFAAPFTPLAATPAVNGLTGELVANNPNKNSLGLQINPFRLAPNQAFTCSQNHSYNPEQQAVHSGLMDLFVQKTGGTGTGCASDGSTVMGYYDGNTVTAMWNYAQHYAMSDNHFGSTFGPSTPGAINLVSGQTLGGILHNATSNGNAVANSNSVTVTTPTISVSNVTDIGDLDAYLDDCGNDKGGTVVSATLEMTSKNIGDLLNAKGLSWGWFQGGFRPTADATFNDDGTLKTPAVCGMSHIEHTFPQPSGLVNPFNPGVSIQTATADYVSHHAGFMYYASTRNPHHVKRSSVAAIGTAGDAANHNYDTADFFDALSAGNLPAVSFIKAPAYQNGHPGNSDPLAEQAWLVQTINAIQASSAWPTTAIIVTYDDSDGWYDHVSTPIVSTSNSSSDALAGAGNCGTAQTATAEARCGHAFRLPYLVISPWARANYVDNAFINQASTAAFIEFNWSLGDIDGSSTPAAGTASFDRTAGAINSMFSFTGLPNTKRLILNTNGTVQSFN